MTGQLLQRTAGCATCWCLVWIQVGGLAPAAENNVNSTKMEDPVRTGGEVPQKYVKLNNCCSVNNVMQKFNITTAGSSTSSSSSSPSTSDIILISYPSLPVLNKFANIISSHYTSSHARIEINGPSGLFNMFFSS